MAKAKKEIQHGIWLAREVEDRTLTFLVCVEIEPNPETEGEFTATILSLKNSVIVDSGSNPAEACDNVLSLFRKMVDHCLDTNSLKDFLGKEDIMEEVDEPISSVLASLRKLEKRAEKSSGHKFSRASKPLLWLFGTHQLVCAG